MKKFYWYSKSTILLLTLLAGFLGYQKFMQYRLQKSIQKEQNLLQKQIADLEKNNEELEKTLNFLESDSYKELVARQQLNMQKLGEQTYSFSENDSTLKTSDETKRQKQTNVQKWLSYFLNGSTPEIYEN